MKSTIPVRTCSIPDSRPWSFWALVCGSAVGQGLLKFWAQRPWEPKPTVKFQMGQEERKEISLIFLYLLTYLV